MLPHHKEPSSRHALKGQKHLAQGNTLGISTIRLAPCKGKSLMFAAPQKVDTERWKTDGK